MAAFADERFGELFRERAQISEALRQAQQEAESLTLEHNSLIRAAEQAATSGGRQRAQLRASRVGEEGKRARARVEQLSKDFHKKETEIADLIGALLAASRPLLSNSTLEQLTEHLAAISQHLQRIDDGLRPIAPAFEALQTAILDQTGYTQSVYDRHSVNLEAVMSAAGTAAATLTHIEAELRHQSRSLQVIGSKLPAPVDRQTRRPGAPIVQMGWRRGTPAVAEPRSPDLPPETISALPEQVTVLLFASEPRDQPRTDLDKEIREILTRISEAKFGDHIILRPWLATQAFDLIPNFNRYKPHMVQFSGHGTEDGVLMMGPRDRSEPVAADRLIQMLRWTGEDLRIVFFNICDSEEHARAAAQLVDGCIGMRGKMHDTPARSFAAHLYSGLAFGCSLRSSFHQACAAIGDEPDSAVPQLFFRNGSDPHKTVLVRPGGGDDH
jgi:hypothetical protein